MQNPHSLFDIQNMSEDCLFLNVFGPSIQDRRSRGDETLLPVMVFIHGGAFSFGASVEVQVLHTVRCCSGPTQPTSRYDTTARY